LETQQKFLSFQLGLKDTAVIPLQHIIEVFQISLMEICVVPHMPSCVVGTYNWRGEMLWIVDLEEMVGYTSSDRIDSFSKFMAIVLQYNDKSLGLLVRQLMDIELLDPTQIKYPESQFFSSDIYPFLEGYFIYQNQSGDMMISLDASAIVQSSLWKNYN
jgi:positive phototaxis protein PixI